MTGTLEFTVYDKDFVRVGLLGDPISATVTLALNAVGTASIVIPETHIYADVLSAPGARVVVDYRLTDTDVFQIMSGPVDEMDGTVSPSATRTYTVNDDFWLLTAIYGWPSPTADLTAQGDDSVTDIRTGNAEQVVKDFVSANAEHFEAPLAVAPPPSPARGSAITASCRWQPLADVLFPAATDAGIVVTLAQGGEGVTLDCRLPDTYARPLTVDSGVIIGGTWSRKRPTAQAVVVGVTVQQTTMTASDGSSTTSPASHDYVSAVSTTAPAAWGYVGEAYSDAADINTSDSTWQADATAAGQLVLANAGATYKLDLTLTDTEAFAFKVSYDLGDYVSVQLAPDVIANDQITGVTLAYTRGSGGGLVITPTVGTASDEIDQLHDAIDTLARAYRRLRTR